MKNSIKWLGIIALIAVIGFSFVACGEGPEGPQGDPGTNGTNGTNGQKGDKGDTGSEGPMRPDILLTYIPEESGLLGTTWRRNTNTAIINNDGYTIGWTLGSSQVTDQVLSYGKRPDGSHVVTSLEGSTVTLYRISGNTMTVGGSTTYTKVEE
jgi:hypothetical protein